MKRLPFALLLLLAFGSWPAWPDGGRYAVTTPLRLRDLESGQEFTVPGNSGFRYSIIEVAKGDSRIRVFDREGKELRGEFTIPAQELQEARAREIGAGLRVAAEGPKGNVPGCCDVDKAGAEAVPVPAAPGPPAVKKPEAAALPEKKTVRTDPPAVNTRRPAVVSPSLVATPSSPGFFPVPPWAAEEAAPPPPGEPRSRFAGASTPGRRGRPNSVSWDSENGFVSENEPEETEPEEEAGSFSRSDSSGGRYCRLYRKFRGKVPDVPLRQILYYLSRDPNQDISGRRIQDRSVVSFADYSQSSDRERFYRLDLESGEVTQEKVSHGSGTCYYSGRDRICSGGTTAMLKRCGTGNHYTRSGFYRVESTYYSAHGFNNGWPMLSRSRSGSRNGLRLRGLTPGVNWNSEGEGIVMHEARYNNERVGTPMGRSNGCVAFAPGCLRRLVKDISGGSLFYSYAPQCADQMRAVKRQIAGWENFCR